MPTRQTISLLLTPRLWFADLAIDAGQNDRYYTHKLGCWLAAIEERLPPAAKEKGNRWGGLLYRLPVGAWAGSLLTLVSLWPWVVFWFGRAGNLRREYLPLYLAAWVEATLPKLFVGPLDWRIAIAVGVACMVVGMVIVHWSRERGVLAKLLAVVGAALSVAAMLGAFGLALLSFAPAEAKVKVGQSIYRLVKRVEPFEYAAVRDDSGAVSYSMWVAGKSLATERVDGASRVRLDVNPERLVLWLDRTIYRGSLLWVAGKCLGCVLGTLLALSAIGRVWDWYRRKRAMNGIFRRGARLVSLDKWNRVAIGPWWMRQRIGMSLRVSGNGGLAHISTKKMTTHMVEFVKTGGGKTINHTQILNIARENDWVVICSGAELMRKFCREGDFVIDPTLKRGARWATEKEITSPVTGRGLTAGIFPMAPGEIAFFVEAVQEGLASILLHYSADNASKMEHKEQATTAALGKWLRNPGKQIMKRAKGTSIAARMNPKSPETMGGMEGSFARAADSFAMMPGPDEGYNEFCARLWVEALNRGEHPGNIFFPASGVTEDAIKPVTTAILNYILKLLRDSKDDAAKRRQLVIVLDEIKTNFNHIEGLEDAITNLRKFGVFIVFGVHAIEALQGQYGDKKASVIVGQPGLKLIGGTDSPESADYAAKVIGKQEIWVLETNFNKQDGDAHRHSVGYRLDTKERVLVTPDQVTNLKDRHGYLRCGEVVTSIVLSYRTMPEQTFEPRIIPFTIDEDEAEDESPAQQSGIPPKGEPVAKIDGGPPVPYAAMQAQIENAVAAEAVQRKKLRVLAFINTQKRGGQGSLVLMPSVRELRREPAGVSR